MFLLISHDFEIMSAEEINNSIQLESCVRGARVCFSDSERERERESSLLEESYHQESIHKLEQPNSPKIKDKTPWTSNVQDSSVALPDYSVSATNQPVVMFLHDLSFTFT